MKFKEGDRVSFPKVNHPGTGTVTKFHRHAGWGEDLFLVNVDGDDGPERILAESQMVAI